MKKINNKYKSKLFKAVVLSLCVFCGSPAFAAASSGDSMADLINLINEIYNNTIKFVNDTLYALDPFVTDVSTANNNIVTTGVSISNASRNTVVNMIKYYLTGEEVKLPDAVNFTKTAYQNVVKDQSISTIKTYNDIFSVSTDFTKDVTGAVPQYDINSLLVPLQYDNTQLDNAQAFIHSIESLSPPPALIRISSDFVIPYSPKTNEYSTHVTISSSLASQIQNDLRNNKDYLKYLNGVNKAVIVRAIFMQPVAEAYQNRVSYNNAPSAAQLDYDEATMRLKNDSQDSYYQQMQSAPPSVVARESLFLLAEIHYDLYLLRRQNEQMLVQQSISGIQTSSFSSMLDQANVNIVAKKIYCEVYPKDTTCTTSTSTGTTTSPTDAITQAIPKS